MTRSKAATGQPPAAAAAVPAQPSRPERWAASAGDAAHATLLIPADAARERIFEIAVAMTVHAGPAACGEPGCWHQMTVLADGQQQWARREPTHNAGAFDGLDYRFQRSVPVGRALRIVVQVAAQGSRRRSLEIEVDEV